MAGDVLSSVIVVKLPFPIPDPISDYEQAQYEDFRDYLSEVITPNRIIKLKQWIGRGICRETDTAVFSILDSKVGMHSNYRNEILSAIPMMPVTDRIACLKSNFKIEQ